MAHGGNLHKAVFLGMKQSAHLGRSVNEIVREEIQLFCIIVNARLYCFKESNINQRKVPLTLWGVKIN